MPDVEPFRFGKWLALYSVNGSDWHCRCDCGNERTVPAARLRAGRSTACGQCKEIPDADRRHELYAIWSTMMARCYNPKNKDYVRYGGRGITVCERWHVFESFVEDVSPRPPGLQLDRRENNGPYSPENFRWATVKEQALNRTNNRWLTAFGETKLVIEWAELSGLGYNAILARLQDGWTAEEAVSLPKSTRIEKARQFNLPVRKPT